MDTRTCPRCQKPNACAIANQKPAESCWCMQQPPAGKRLTTTLEQSSCFCEKCLRELRQQQDQQ